jgi:hypothetical protein
MHIFGSRMRSPGGSWVQEQGIPELARARAVRSSARGYWVEHEDVVDLGARATDL